MFKKKWDKGLVVFGILFIVIVIICAIIGIFDIIKLTGG